MKDVGKSERSHRRGSTNKEVNYADLDDWKIEEDYENNEKVVKKSPSKNGRGRPKGKKTPVKKGGKKGKFHCKMNQILTQCLIQVFTTHTDGLKCPFLAQINRFLLKLDESLPKLNI